MTAMARTSPCTQDIRRGRLRKSGQFLDAASLIADRASEEAEIADVYVTLCVHAGIAASDVICCARLGQHASGEDHSDAVALLRKADDAAARHLRVLLGMKTKAGYSHRRATAGEAKRAGRAAEALLESARRANAG
jgi:hypothetical protein